MTGADFDIESVRIDHRGRFWFSDEFGPFLLKTDAN
ncbi:MAG: esterase-like activity of phytase family protein, partial [Elioraea sp.]|nr:esterase-like activity of phytase family protein [Elioraea sp.]